MRAIAVRAGIAYHARSMNTPSPLLHLSPRDNICAATRALTAGETLAFEESSFAVESEVPVGHKVCVRPIRRGEKVLKYGASIGSATCDIRPGQHVHLHNLESDYLPSKGREIS